MMDADHLPTPSDLTEILIHLRGVVAGVELLGTDAQQTFWDDAARALEALPDEDLSLDGVIGTRSAQALGHFLLTMCGPRLAEVMTGVAKEAFSDIMSDQVSALRKSQWDAMIDRRLEATRGTDREGALRVSVLLGRSGQPRVLGKMRRGEDDSLILTPDSGVLDEFYFFSNDVLAISFLDPEIPSEAAS